MAEKRKWLTWTGAAKCDFCAEIPVATESGVTLAERVEGALLYDAATKQGPWATMCHEHFGKYARGVLGLGAGQKYQCDGNRNFVKVDG